MRDVMLMVATVTPIDELIAKVADAAQQARINPSDENIKLLEFNATMLLMHQTTKGDMKNLSSLIKEIDDTDKLRDLIKSSPN